jgi:hypothetical protein
MIWNYVLFHDSTGIEIRTVWISNYYNSNTRGMHNTRPARLEVLLRQTIVGHVSAGAASVLFFQTIEFWYRTHTWMQHTYDPRQRSVLRYPVHSYARVNKINTGVRTHVVVPLHITNHAFPCAQLPVVQTADIRGPRWRATRLRCYIYSARIVKHNIIVYDIYVCVRVRVRYNSDDGFGSTWYASSFVDGDIGFRPAYARRIAKTHTRRIVCVRACAATTALCVTNTCDIGHCSPRVTIINDRVITRCARP